MILDKIKNIFSEKKTIQTIEDTNCILDSLNLEYTDEYLFEHDVGKEYWGNFFKINELKMKLNECILESKAINIDIDIHIGNRSIMYDDTKRSIDIHTDITWMNGDSKKILEPKLDLIIDNWFSNIKRPKTIRTWRFIKFTRQYPDDIILICAKKYADCINKCLPINMVTIKIMKYNDVSVYDMVIRELDMVEDIDSYINNGE